MKSGVAVVMAVAVLVSGCGTWKRNLTSKTPIEATEGLIVANTVCEPGVLSTEWYPSGVRSKGYTGGFNLAFVLQCNQGHLVYAVPAGSYFMGKALGMAFLDYPESDTVRFTVQAGKVNYVGDFYIAVDDRGGVKFVSPPVIRDDSTAARKAVETSHPWALERYEFVTSMAERTDKPAPAAPSTSL